MERGVDAATVVHGDAAQDVVRAVLRVLDLDVEVAVVVEDPGVDQFVLRLEPAAGSVRGDQILVGVRLVGVLVQPPLVRVCGEVVEVEVVLLHVLAVVALGVRQPEESFFQDRVVFVPQGDGETQALMRVGDAGEAVLTPPVRPRS